MLAVGTRRSVVSVLLEAKGQAREYAMEDICGVSVISEVVGVL